MNPDSGYESVPVKYSGEEALLFESRIADLMFDIGSKFSKIVKSVQVVKDDNFVHRRDRATNDIHLFLELNNGEFFHLRAYTRHMLDMEEMPANKIFLTGYRKPSVSQTGGEHSLRQDWYPWDAEIIAEEVISQNKELF